jgi:hypothetical protein
MAEFTMSHEPSSRDRVAFDELWRWVAPWLAGAFLVLAALLGLFTASRAQTDGSYVIGFVTAGLALLMLAWRLKRALDGDRVPASVLVDDATALVVVIALLAVLAVGGLLLAARSDEAVPEAVGYALFGFALVFIFANLKHYFDARERGG